MDEQSPALRTTYGTPIEMRLPIVDNPEFESVYDPVQSKGLSFYAGEKNLVTFMDESVYRKISEHADSDKRNEIGGALLGRYCIDRQIQQRFILVTEVFPATGERNDRFASPVVMKFTHTFFRKLDEYLDRVHEDDPNIIRLGMYHSHPGYGVFMSATDISTFRDIFVEPWHISFIIDPINQDAGVFYWQEKGGTKEISPKTGFSLFKLRHRDEAKNESVNDASPAEPMGTDLGEDGHSNGKSDNNQPNGRARP
jgi:proteasome lid subunit RPN8/RPN11